MVAQALAAGGSLVSGALGMMAGRKAAKEAKKARQIAMNAANQAYSPINVAGPGGVGVSFGGPTPIIPNQTEQPMLGGGSFGGPSAGYPPAGQLVYEGSKGKFYSDGKGGRVTAEGLQVVPGTRGTVKRSDIGSAAVSAGDLESLRQNLAGTATGFSQQTGLDPNTMALLANLQSSAGLFGDAGLRGLGQLQDYARSGMGLSATGLADSSDFANQLRMQAQGAFGGLAGTQEQARQQTLDLLRQQAAPEEERSFANLQDQLFATGRLGTSGGGLQTEAFARGLGRADLERQLMAGQEGRSAQTAQMNLGTGLASQQDDTLTNALQRFRNMISTNQGLAKDRFERTGSISDLNYQRAQDLLKASPQFLEQAFQQGNIENINQYLKGIGAVNTNALNFANFARGLMGDQANTRTGAANAMMNTGTDNTTGNMFAQLSNSLAGQTGGQGVLGALGGLFKRGDSAGGDGYSSSSDVLSYLDSLGDDFSSTPSPTSKDYPGSI